MTRSPRRAAVALAILAACLFTLVYMNGCASYPAEYPHQGPVTAKLNDAISAVTVRVTWHDSVDSVNSVCGRPKAGSLSFTYGCATPSPIRTFSRDCEIHALRPRDWNDQVSMAILGHELFHCFSLWHD